MTLMQTRRQVLTTLSLVGSAGLLGAPVLAAEGTYRNTRDTRNTLEMMSVSVADPEKSLSDNNT